MFGIKKEVLQTAAIALAAFVVVSAIQRHVLPVPFVGNYLPK